MDIIPLNSSSDKSQSRVRPCTKCGETDPTKFYYSPKGYKDSWCRKCDNLRSSASHRNRDVKAHQLRQKEWRDARPHYDRKDRYKSYGLTIEQYNALFASQNGVCKICGNPPSGKKSKETFLHVDHDHVTGQIRGLLCNKCNRGLGQFLDKPELLRRAAKYLDEFSF